MPDPNLSKVQSDNTPGPVLAAVDFSADSEAAVLWAADYAACKLVPLLILHVVHDPAHDPGHYREKDDDWSEPMANIAERKMDEFLQRLRTDHPGQDVLKEAKPVIVSGLPAGRIVEFAEREKACLITVGSRGRTGLEHVLIGSVAEDVIQHSLIPVTVVKQAGPGA